VLVDPPLPDRPPICVLSVGRSGSSLATRVLNVLGVYLGDEGQLLPPTPDNQLGYWENEAIYRVNEEILQALGGTWYRPPELSSGWEMSPALEALRGRGRQALATLASAEAPRWGFKDPRTVILLPFWRQLVGRMDYVICVRDVQAVISSVANTALKDAEGPLTERLWLSVNARALAETVSERRVFVFYEDWFEEPRRVAEMLAKFVNGAASEATPEAIDAATRCFRRELRRADSRAVSDAPTDTPELAAMYEHLRLVASHDVLDSVLRVRQAAVAQGLVEAYDVRREVCNAAVQAAEQSDAAQRSLRDRITELQQMEDELRAALQSGQTRLADIEGSISWRIGSPLRAVKRQLRDRSPLPQNTR
jgi:hypothetical protein